MSTEAITPESYETGPIATRSADPESHAVELERLNVELTKVALRATKLLDVTGALSQASSVEEVVGVVLDKGFAVVEASGGLLIWTEGDQVEVLGSRGFSPHTKSLMETHGRDADVATMEAVRTGAPIWIESFDDYRKRADDSRILTVSLRQAHNVCEGHRDIATASLIEIWVDETERRTWFLFEASRSGDSSGH